MKGVAIGPMQLLQRKKSAAGAPTSSGLLWRQLPAHSPMTLGAASTAVRHALRLGDDARPRVREIIRAAYEADEAILVGSGTQALQLGIRAAARLVGDDAVVALPAFSCFDVASAAVGAEARITLYDIDPSTLAPDFDSLARALAEGARVVVVVPLFGIPIEWQTLHELTAACGAVVIEDAAQGHGAFWHEHPLGGLGVISTLSFGRGKGWTGGKGGALLVRARSGERLSLSRWEGFLPGEASTLAEFGVLLRATAHWALGHPSRYRLPASIPWLGLGETRYHDPQLPTGMTRAAAGLLEHTQALAAREALARRVNAQCLLERVPSGSHLRLVCPPAKSAPGYLRLPVRASRGLAGFGDASRAMQLGVMRSYPSTLAALPQVRARLGRATGSWPGAEELVRELITLPTHSLVTDGDREALAFALAQYVG
jgi:perosamine synthetase